MINICNTDRVITITPTGAWVPGNPVYTDTLSSKIKALSKFIVVSRITWNMPAGVCALAGAIHGGGSATTPISPTGTKAKDINIGMGWDGLPIRLGDTGQCGGVFTFPGPVFVFCTCNFQVTNAGQIKASCN